MVTQSLPFVKICSCYSENLFNLLSGLMIILF